MAGLKDSVLQMSLTAAVEPRRTIPMAGLRSCSPAISGMLKKRMDGSDVEDTPGTDDDADTFLSNWAKWAETSLSSDADSAGPSTPTSSPKPKAPQVSV